MPLKDADQWDLAGCWVALWTKTGKRRRKEGVVRDEPHGCGYWRAEGSMSDRQPLGFLRPPPDNFTNSLPPIVLRWDVSEQEMESCTVWNVKVLFFCFFPPTGMLNSVVVAMFLTDSLSKQCQQLLVLSVKLAMVVEFFLLVLKETTTKKNCFSCTWKIFFERQTWHVLNAHCDQLSEEKEKWKNMWLSALSQNVSSVILLWKTLKTLIYLTWSKNTIINDPRHKLDGSVTDKSFSAGSR